MKQGQQGNPALPSFHTSMVQSMPRMRTISQSKKSTPVQEEHIVQDKSSKNETPDNIRTVQQNQAANQVTLTLTCKSTTRQTAKWSF